MKKITAFAFIIAFAVSALNPAAMAFAKHDKEHGKEHGHGKKNKHGKKGSSDKGGLLIGDSNRETIKIFLKDHYGKSCPPGLAKKNNGCLPPGIAKKYAIGQRLPDDVFGSSLPGELLKLLYPPRAGQKYIQVDKDVLLIDQASRKVIDAVTLLSAVGN